ncbi:Rnf-Nqr domain containing protein, partial [Salegentibacter sp.]|uniref:Rnf-Nqr domain containing protein n=1 Tax=Salegentibacter sp. TaxID=1903072 RepID=UPI0035692E8B
MANEKKYTSEEKEAKKKEMILFMSNSEEREHFLSKANRKLLSDPLDDNNPITVQVLGICSALAITVQLEPAVVMAIAVVAVMAFSNMIISMLRNMIPSR